MKSAQKRDGEGRPDRRFNGRTNHAHARLWRSADRRVHTGSHGRWAYEYWTNPQSATIILCRRRLQRPRHTSLFVRMSCPSGFSPANGRMLATLAERTSGRARSRSTSCSPRVTRLSFERPGSRVTLATTPDPGRIPHRAWQPVRLSVERVPIAPSETRGVTPAP